MPQLPDSSAVHINGPLTNVSVAYLQGQNWIADQVFPTVPVTNQGDLYWKYNKGDWYRVEAQLRAPATESAGGGWNMTTDSYYAKVYAVHKDLDDQLMANADSNFNLESDATRWVTQQLMLKRDYDWVSTYFKPGVWGTDKTGVASGPTAGQFTQWDQSGSDPVGDITDIITSTREQTGYNLNTLVLGPYVYRALIQNASILDRIKYSERGIIGRDLLTTLFEVDRIVIADTIRNTAAQGATTTMAYMAGKHALLTYSTPRPSLLEATAGYVFTWSGLLGAGAYGGRIKRFRMEEIASWRIEGEMAYDMKVVAPDLGVFFSGAVA